MREGGLGSRAGLHDAGAQPGELQRYRPALRYLVIDELHRREEELSGAGNAVAALFRLERSRQPEDIQKVVHELVGWLGSPEQAGLRRDFAAWMSRTFLPSRAPGQEIPEFHDLQEVDAMLSETVKEWTKEWEEQGRKQGRREVVRHMLARKLSIAEIAELTGLSTDEVEKLSEEKG